MPSSIESYIPQVAIQKPRRQAVIAWSLIFTISFVWILSIISAPLAKTAGFNSFADSIYTFFSYLCHQIPSRSFHIENHAFAVCARCFGFYFGLLFGFIIYPTFRSLDNTDSFPRFWLFLAMIPMGVDWSLTFFDIWENTHLSRFLTGGILGAACAFFIIPALIEISFFLFEKFQKRS